MAGTVVLLDGFFNRDTRDALSPVEQSYLHESFMYTGGGLALTALTARSLFKSGVTFRIMAANPCELFVQICMNRRSQHVYRVGPRCQSRWQYRDYDGSVLHPSRENRTKTPLLAGT